MASLSKRELTIRYTGKAAIRRRVAEAAIIREQLARIDPLALDRLLHLGGTFFLPEDVQATIDHMTKGRLAKVMRAYCREPGRANTKALWNEVTDPLLWCALATAIDQNTQQLGRAWVLLFVPNKTSWCPYESLRALLRLPHWFDSVLFVARRYQEMTR